MATRNGKLTLHLGVIDQPYRANGKKSRAITTGDVAKILEERYGLFQGFYDANESFIKKEIANSVKGALESMLSGRHVDPFGRATGAIENRFRDFVATGKVERIGLPGVPTAAAKAGVNHRLAHPYAKSNPRRPSFRDTGLLMLSFKSWVTREK